MPSDDRLHLTLSDVTTSAGYIRAGNWLIESGRIVFPDGSMHATPEWLTAHDAALRESIAAELDAFAAAERERLDLTDRSGLVGNWLGGITESAVEVRKGLTP